MLNFWRALAVTLAAMVLVLGGGFAIQAGMLHADWRPDLGNVPEWIAALGTVGAIAAAFVAALAYRHSVRTRTEDEVQRREAERRQQAELLSAWFVHFGSPRQGPQIGNDPPETINVCQVGLINASQVVVYDLFVVAQCRERIDPPLTVKFDESSDVIRRADGSVEGIKVAMGYLEPVAWDRRRDSLAVGWAKVAAPGRWSVELRLTHLSVTPHQLHLFFRDHRGFYWWRDATGRLTEVPAPADEQNRQTRLREIEHILGEDPTDATVHYLSLRPLPDAAAT
ncbi:hypothetical protein [Mycolicibacterium sp. OfavD-34-C]|uniref:hypothetical protein n=1 Tax=Mycolicibacterium sp. OfavD-34-C TaxID=2917746 RepID=UPI001EF5FBCB|nr:hypothetical protein [Mycolicibacterium sp. OfavD-34-C]MCG7583683.1 hypothetical protein [Mycolicibacterium sp. OfavD-34-C]